MKPNFGRRCSTRLKDYDYSQCGMYFITICTASKHCLFCTNSENSANLSHIGKIARDCWLKVPSHFRNAKLDEFVVMPNHIHGIIVLTDNEEKRAENIQPLQNKSIQENPTQNNSIETSLTQNDSKSKQSEININVGVQYIEPNSPQNRFQHIEPTSTQNRFQHITPRSIGSIVRSYKAAVTRQCRKDEICEIVWQRNFYERVIRSEKELNCLREYIVNNPLNWSLDRENPDSRHYSLGYDKYFEFR